MVHATVHIQLNPTPVMLCYHVHLSLHADKPIIDEPLSATTMDISVLKKVNHACNVSLGYLQYRVWPINIS